MIQLTDFFAMCVNKNRICFIFTFLTHPPTHPLRKTRGPTGAPWGPPCLSALLTTRVWIRPDRCQSRDNGVRRSEATFPAALTDANICSSRVVQEQQWCYCILENPEMCLLHFLCLIYGFFDEEISSRWDLCVFVWHLPLLSHGLCMKPLMRLDIKRCCSRVRQSHIYMIISLPSFSADMLLMKFGFVVSLSLFDLSDGV